MGNKRKRSTRPPRYSRAFDWAMRVLTAVAVLGVVVSLTEMVTGQLGVGHALSRVLGFGLLWLTLGLVFAAVFPFREPPHDGPPRPITTGGARGVPVQRGELGRPRTIQGRFYLPKHALEEPQLAPSSVVLAAIADAVDGVVAAAEHDGRPLAWQTIQVCLLPLPADRGGWQVLAEVEVAQP